MKTLVNISNDNTLDEIIYKTMKIKYLLQLLENKKLVMVNPFSEKWKDPWEGRLYQRFYYDEKGLLISTKSFKDCFFASCWTYNLLDSDIIWKLYASADEGVRIKTSKKKLLKVLKSITIINHDDIYYGKVRYYNKRNLFRRNKGFKYAINKLSLDGNYNIGRSFYSPFFKKRKEFFHENEFRIIVFDRSKLWNNPEELISIPLPNIDFIDEIIFDPRMSAKVLKEHKSDLKNLQFKKPIKQSELYKPIRRRYAI